MQIFKLRSGVSVPSTGYTLSKSPTADSTHFDTNVNTTHFDTNVNTKIFIIPLEILPTERNTQLAVQSSKYLLNRDYNQSSFNSDYMLSTSSLSHTSSGELYLQVSCKYILATLQCSVLYPSY